MSAAPKPALAPIPAVSNPWSAWAVFGADILALELSFALGLTFRYLLGGIFTASIGVDQVVGIATGILLLPLIYYQLGLYPGYLLGPVERLRRRTLATFAIFGGLVAWDSLVQRGVLSRGVLLATLLFALILPPLAEMLTRRILISRRAWGMPVVIVGSGKAARQMAATLAEDRQHGLIPTAYLEPGLRASSPPQQGSLPVSSLWSVDASLEPVAEAAIVCIADLRRQELDLEATLRRLNFPRVIVVPDLPGVASMWVQARDLGGTLGFELKKNLLLRRNHALKLAMDQAIALPLFLASLPVMAVAGAWIKLASPGPVFYRQMRDGLNGKRIAVWKLRTMHTGADLLLDRWFQRHPSEREHWERHFKLRHDPRLIPFIGRLLRRTSLDELPQLWSVLRGEMSLVGPRPLPDYHLSHFGHGFRELRIQVLPGLTGLWQVSARSDGDMEVLEALDTFYIRNWSPWLDLYILARTVSAVLLARGAY